MKVNEMILAEIQKEKEMLSEISRQVETMKSGLDLRKLEGIMQNHNFAYLDWPEFMRAILEESLTDELFHTMDVTVTPSCIRYQNQKFHILFPAGFPAIADQKKIVIRFEGSGIVLKPSPIHPELKKGRDLAKQYEKQKGIHAFLEFLDFYYVKPTKNPIKFLRRCRRIRNVLHDGILQRLNEEIDRAERADSEYPEKKRIYDEEQAYAKTMTERLSIGLKPFTDAGWNVDVRGIEKDGVFYG